MDQVSSGRSEEETQVYAPALVNVENEQRHFHNEMLVDRKCFFAKCDCLSH